MLLAGSSLRQAAILLSGTTSGNGTWTVSAASASSGSKFLERKETLIEEKAEVEKAQFYDKVDQTPLVEQSEELVEEQSDEVGLGPQIDTEPTQVDDNGRQWYYDQEGRYWWRDSFEAEWQLLELEQVDAKIREEGLKENKF